MPGLKFDQPSAPPKKGERIWTMLRLPCSTKPVPAHGGSRRHLRNRLRKQHRRRNTRDVLQLRALGANDESNLRRSNLRARHSRRPSSRSCKGVRSL